jgi:hypothetical protein
MVTEKWANKACQELLDVLKKVAESDSNMAHMAEVIRSAIHDERYIEEPLEYIRSRTHPIVKDGTVFVELQTTVSVHYESMEAFTRAYEPLTNVKILDWDGETHYLIDIRLRLKLGEDELTLS